MRRHEKTGTQGRNTLRLYNPANDECRGDPWVAPTDDNIRNEVVNDDCS
jgi:hypothetical protein